MATPVTTSTVGHRPFTKSGVTGRNFSSTVPQYKSTVPTDQKQKECKKVGKADSCTRSVAEISSSSQERAGMNKFRDVKQKGAAPGAGLRNQLLPGNSKSHRDLVPSKKHREDQKREEKPLRVVQMDVKMRSTPSVFEYSKLHREVETSKKLHRGEKREERPLRVAMVQKVVQIRSTP